MDYEARSHLAGRASLLVSQLADHLQQLTATHERRHQAQPVTWCHLAQPQCRRLRLLAREQPRRRRRVGQPTRRSNDVKAPAHWRV